MIQTLLLCNVQPELLVEFLGALELQSLDVGRTSSSASAEPVPPVWQQPAAVHVLLSSSAAALGMVSNSCPVCEEQV